MPRADIARILPFSAVDGPGNRLVVFFQGCNLRCDWCHNPETWRSCVHCGRCLRSCPSGALTKAAGRVRHDPGRCLDCGACLAVCPHHSSPKTRDMTIAELLAVVRRYRPYISGITLSGGEPTLQHEFIAKLCRRVKRAGLSVYLETNGIIPAAVLRKLVPLIDKFIIDLKPGTPWRTVRELAKRKKIHELRTVILPAGRGNNAATVRSISRALVRVDRAIPLRLVAFRRQGVRGALRRARTPTPGVMRRLCELARRAGLREVVMV